MNIVKNLQARIEDRLTETKTPCKLYATEEAADKAGANIAEIVGNHHETRPANYVVIKIESIGKWTAAIDLNELCGREGRLGGYLGLACDRGFYTY